MPKKREGRRDPGSVKPKQLRKRLRKAEDQLQDAQTKRDRAQARVDALSIIADEIRAQLGEVEQTAAAAKEAKPAKEAKEAKPAKTKPAAARKPSNTAKPAAARKTTAAKALARKPAAARKTAPVKRSGTATTPRKPAADSAPGASEAAE